MNKNIAQPYIKTRYSNASPFVDLGIGGDYSDVNTHQTYAYSQGSGSSGSGSSGSSFNWGGLVDGILGLGNTFVSSFWNNGDKVKAEYLDELRQREQRTNTILWVVLGLVLALGVFLIIRKTK